MPTRSVAGPLEDGSAGILGFGFALADGTVIDDALRDATTGVAGDRPAARFDDPHLKAVVGSGDDQTAPGTEIPDWRDLLHHRARQKAVGPSPTFDTGIGAVRGKAILTTSGLLPEREDIEGVEMGCRPTAPGRRIPLDPCLQWT